MCDPAAVQGYMRSSYEFKSWNLESNVNKILHIVSQDQLIMCMLVSSCCASRIWNIKADGHSSSIKEGSVNKHVWVNIYSMF